MIGFDLDGTITDNWYHKYRWSQAEILKCKTYKKQLDRLKQILIGSRPVIVPVEKCRIITNRPLSLFEITFQWLIKYKVNFIDIHMAKEFDVNIDRLARYKADVINDLLLSKYIEDEESIRDRLSCMCPDTEIVSPEQALRMGIAKKYYDEHSKMIQIYLELPIEEPHITLRYGKLTWINYLIKEKIAFERNGRIAKIKYSVDGTRATLIANDIGDRKD